MKKVIGMLVAVVAIVGLNASVASAASYSVTRTRNVVIRNNVVQNSTNNTSSTSTSVVITKSGCTVTNTVNGVTTTTSC